MNHSTISLLTTLFDPSDLILFRPVLGGNSLAGVASATVAPAMALPEVLAAWRACERELAGMTAASPDHVLLEANVGMLRAMYQRLYVERMRR